jgi:hypothetical protein
VNHLVKARAFTADETVMSSLNAFEAPPRSSRVPTRLLPRTLHVPDDSNPGTTGPGTTSPVTTTSGTTTSGVTTSGKVQEVMRLMPRIPAASTVRPTSPRTGMMAVVAPAPAPAPAGAKAASHSRGLPVRVLAALLLMALAVAGVFVYQRTRHSGPPHPSEWDPRVAPVVRFVERERGLTFRHPVFVDLLSDSEYARKVAEANTGVDDTSSNGGRSADRRELANAFGFATAYDSSASDTALSADNSHGTYSTRTDRILLRSTTLTAGARVVLAHQLTHALQAQHFDLRLGGLDELALSSVAEADATRIGNTYLTSLTPEEQTAASSENAMGASEADALARVPWPMIEFRFAPFWLGPTLIDDAVASSGNAGVDALFRNLPPDTELLSPWRRRAAPNVEAPTVRAPSTTTLVQAPSTLSVLRVLVMLDAWLPWQMARGAVDHWVGGSYVAYREHADGRLCIAAAAAFDAAPTAFADALTFWAAAAGSTAAPVVEGRTVRFTACDRGPSAANPPTPVLGPSTELLLERTAVTAAGTADPAAITAALCVERTMIDNPAAAPLLGVPNPTADQQGVIELVRAAARQTCGA